METRTESKQPHLPVGQASFQKAFKQAISLARFVMNRQNIRKYLKKRGHRKGHWTRFSQIGEAYCSTGLSYLTIGLANNHFDAGFGQLI